MLEVVPHRVELETVEEIPDRGSVPLAGAEIRRGEPDVKVGDQAHQFPVQEDLLAAGGEVLPELRGHLADGFVDTFERPVGGDELGRCLLPHTRHAGQVVGAVTAQCRVFDVLVGTDAVLLVDVDGVGDDRVADPAARVDDLHRASHQLEGITVAGDDEDFPSVVDGLAGERGDDVVGLVALGAELGDLKGLEDFVHQWQLAPEVVRGLGSLCLVLGVRLRAERLAGNVPSDGDPVGVVVLEQPDEHPGESEHGVGHLPRLGCQIFR